MKTIYEVIGENLKRERLKRSISIKEISKSLSITESLYRKIEKGTHQIEPYQLFFLSRKLNTEIDDLMFPRRSFPKSL
jgi:transcriptional regulator with XRE-family HTH domain